MQRKLLLLIITLGCISCTEVRYIQQPEYPIINAKDEKVLIWPFQHSSISISEKNEQELNEKLSENACVTFISFNSVSDLCYKNLIDFNDSISIDNLKLLYSLSEIKYLLIGKVIDKSEKRGFYGPIVPEYYKEISYPFPEDEARWLTYEFELYDLSFYSKVYSLTVKVEAVSEDFEGSSGDVTRVYSLSSANLDAIAIRKGIKKLNKLFNCK